MSLGTREQIEDRAHEWHQPPGLHNCLRYGIHSFIEQIFAGLGVRPSVDAKDAAMNIKTKCMQGISR